MPTELKEKSATMSSNYVPTCLSMQIPLNHAYLG